MREEKRKGEDKRGEEREIENKLKGSGEERREKTMR